MFICLGSKFYMAHGWVRQIKAIRLFHTRMHGWVIMMKYYSQSFMADEINTKLDSIQFDPVVKQFFFNIYSYFTSLK